MATKISKIVNDLEGLRLEMIYEYNSSTKAEREYLFEKFKECDLLFNQLQQKLNSLSGVPNNRHLIKS